MAPCNRCKVEIASMIHSRKVRKDGSTYIIYWCRLCQKTKQNTYNRKSRFYDRIKDQAGWNAAAKETYLRISAKYAPTIQITYDKVDV